MKNLVQLHRKIAPELVELLECRYHILRHIQYTQPIGRRALATALNMGERIVRSHVDFLKSAGLLDFSAQGMSVTEDGQTMLSDLAEYVRLLHGLSVLEEELASKLGLQEVIIIPGDSENDASVLRELGRAAALVLGKKLAPYQTVAVSGGSTMAMAADSVIHARPDALVVPARGGLGEQVEYQANTIAATLARNLGCSYRLLHIPDGIHEEAMKVILQSDPHAKEIREILQKTHVLMCGIGKADEMARRRHMEPEVVAEIVRAGAVGEALGQYCDVNGEIVHATSSVGLDFHELSRLDAIIAVAGGKSKAEAIIAVCRSGLKGGILVTDEHAAKAMHLLM